MTRDSVATHLVGRRGLAAVLIALLAIVPTLTLAAGTGSFMAHPTTPRFGGGNSVDVDVADLDGDGDLDAVVANSGNEAETVWLNDGLGGYTAHPTTPGFGASLGNSFAVALGDLDG